MYGRSRWLPDEPVLALSTACAEERHAGCESAALGLCGCLCHLSPGRE
jgi:hypothetical protein